VLVTLRDNRRSTALALLAVGVLSILFGLNKMLWSGTDCGGQAMTEGSVCEHTGANARTLTVEEQRADNRTLGIVSIVGSVPFLFFAVRGFVRARKPLPVYSIPGPAGPPPAA
jgi:hypothetical protein